MRHFLSDSDTRRVRFVGATSLFGVAPTPRNSVADGALAHPEWRGERVVREREADV